MCGPANPIGKRDFLLPQNPVKINFFVFHEVNGPSGGEIRERKCTAECGEMMWRVSIEGFNIQYA
jgi:hypothetical protein